MAIIYSYPKLTSLQNKDLLLISDVSSKNKPTMRVELGDLANFIVTSTGTVTGSGTTDTLPIWTDGPNGELGDSNITQNISGVRVQDKLNVDDDAQFNTSVRISESLAIDYPAGFPNISQSHLGAFFAFQVNRPTPGSTDNRQGVVHIGRGSNGTFTQFDHTLNLYTPNDFTDPVNFSDAKAFVYQYNDNYKFARIQAEDYAGGIIAPLWEVGDFGESTNARWQVNSGGYAKYSDGVKDFFSVTPVSSIFNVPLELADALIDGTGSTGTPGQVLSSTGSTTQWIPAGGGGGIGGSGTTNQLTKWSSTNTVTDSVMYDDGTNVGIGTTSPAQRLEVQSNDSVQPVAYFRNTGTGPGFTVRTDSDATGKEILSLFSGSSYKFYFGRDGKLGIGTINPVNELHVENGSTRLDSKSATSIPLGLYSNFGNTGIAIFADDPIANSGQINVDSTGTSGNNEIGMNFAVDGFSSANVKLSLLNTGQLKAHNYGSGSFAGTVANNLAVDANGNIIEESTVATLTPYVTTATPGGSETLTTLNNIVKIGWSGTSGTYVINLPSATTIPYRNLRFTTNGTYPGGGAHKVQITPSGGETIDGAAFYEIAKQYAGISIWSTGTEWIVIQVKA